MGRYLTALIALTALIGAACSHPKPSSPRPPEQSTQVVQTPPPSDQGQGPAPGEVVPRVLAEVKAMFRQKGKGIEIRDRLADARSLASHDARLLADVARVAVEFDPKLALEIAQAAVTADDAYMPAHVALGAALVADGRYEESRGDLERAYEGAEHGLDAGYQLALTLEALGDTGGAHTLLTDLITRFPDSVESKQSVARLSAIFGRWPAPGTAGTIVAGWKADGWWATSQLLIGVRKDEETVEAIGLDGKRQWVLTCGGKAIDLAVNESGTLAMMSAGGQGCLIDLVTGTVLLKRPGVAYYPSTEGLTWRGDLIAFGENVEGGPMGYFSTNWKVYRMNRDAAGKIDLQLIYEAMDGSRKAALSSDGKTLLSWMGNHGVGRPRLFQDGRKITEYPDIAVGEQFALDPRDDRFYFLSYGGVLQARSLGGKVLWEAQADEQSFPLLTWTDTTGRFRIAVNYQGGTAVYSDMGERLWTTPGFPLMPIGVNAMHYLMTHDGRDILIYDGSGKVVARYPSAAWFTKDGQAMVRPVGGQIYLYRLP
jgi:tetratricopeptide (TPR) repeat protein